MGMWNGNRYLENTLVVSYGVKHALATESSSPTPKYVCNRSENFRSHKSPYATFIAVLVITTLNWKHPKALRLVERRTNYGPSMGWNTAQQ